MGLRIFKKTVVLAKAIPFDTQTKSGLLLNTSDSITINGCTFEFTKKPNHYSMLGIFQITDSINEDFPKDTYVLVNNIFEAKSFGEEFDSLFLVNIHDMIAIIDFSEKEK